MNGISKRRISDTDFRDLGDSMKNMNVQAQRRSSRLAQSPANADTLDNIELPEEEEDDETFDPELEHDSQEGDSSTEETSVLDDETEGDELDEVEVVKKCTQFDTPEHGDGHEQQSEETVFADDGASDFWPSDCEREEDVVTHTQYNKHSAQKYHERGKVTFYYILKNASCQHTPPHWVSTLRKYSFEERRWVNKGPVLLYFIKFGNKIQMVANYLYGIKSIALNMEIKEKSEWMYQCLNTKGLVFSSFGYNYVTRADTVTDTVPLSHYFPHHPKANEQFLPVLRCHSQLKCVNEEHASVYSVQFLSQEVREEFSRVLLPLIKWVEFIKMQERYHTFKTPQPIRDERHYNHLYQQLPLQVFPTSPEQELMDFSLCGYRYSPVLDSSNNQPIHRILCLYCGAFSLRTLPKEELNKLHAASCWMRRPGEQGLDLSNFSPDLMCVTRH